MIHPKQRWSTCYYMSSTSKVPENYLDCFGFIFSIQTAPRYRYLYQHKYPWCLDNDEFNDKFNMRKWFVRLRQLKGFSDTCLFVLARDKVGDYKATLDMFPKYAKIIRAFGYPVAFATQDGLTPEITPWNDFDTLFIGGSDNHKLGKEAGLLINEAINRGKWVHIGRVNSPSRIHKFWRADSWDGTCIGREPDKHGPAIAKAVRNIRALKDNHYKLWEDF